MTATLIPFAATATTTASTRTAGRFGRPGMAAGFAAAVANVAVIAGARRPRHTFVVTTVVLSALSMVPPAIVDADIATKLVLGLTHVVAAMIIIPAIASRLTN